MACAISGSEVSGVRLERSLAGREAVSGVVVVVAPTGEGGVVVIRARQQEEELRVTRFQDGPSIYQALIEEWLAEGQGA